MVTIFFFILISRVFFTLGDESLGLSPLIFHSFCFCLVAIYINTHGRPISIAFFLIARSAYNPYTYHILFKFSMYPMFIHKTKLSKVSQVAASSFDECVKVAAFLCQRYRKWRHLLLMNVWKWRLSFDEYMKSDWP